MTPYTYIDIFALLYIHTHTHTCASAAVLHVCCTLPCAQKSRRQVSREFRVLGRLLFAKKSLQHRLGRVTSLSETRHVPVHELFQGTLVKNLYKGRTLWDGALERVRVATRIMQRL